MFPIPETLDTPTVVVDHGRLMRNITGWSAAMTERGVGLRPHTKTSKCLEIIDRQVAAGTVGLTVATLGEAEVLADAGHTELFQAFPMWAGHPDRARRLAELHERTRLMVGVESAESAAALGAATARSSRPLEVLIELDPGLHRSGVDPSDAVRLAQACEAAGLGVRGCFTFGGHGYSPECDATEHAADDEVAVLAAAAAALGAAGFDTSVLSAGSTPTARASARPPVTDERPGTYVFHDAQQLHLGTATIDEISLGVVTTVVASHADGRFVLDAGSKALSSDRPAWLAGYGHLPGYPEARVHALSEHHAVVLTTGPRPRIGERVVVVPNHCCVVVNLVDELVVLDDGVVVDRWRVASRGRNG